MRTYGVEFAPISLSLAQLHTPLRTIIRLFVSVQRAFNATATLHGGKTRGKTIQGRTCVVLDDRRRTDETATDNDVT